MKNNTLPKTVREAFRILDSMLSAEEVSAFLSMSKSEFCSSQHWGLGLWVRNNWIHGGDEDCLRMLTGNAGDGYLIPVPDYVSDLFLQKYYDHLKRTKSR